MKTPDITVGGRVFLALRVAGLGWESLIKGEEILRGVVKL